MPWKVPNLFHRHHAVMQQLTPEEHQALIQKLNHEFNDGPDRAPIITQQVATSIEPHHDIDTAQDQSIFKH